MPKPHFDPGPATTLLDVRLVSLRVTLREACLSPSNSDFSLLTVSFHPTRFCASVSSSTLVSCVLYNDDSLSQRLPFQALPSTEPSGFGWGDYFSDGETIVPT